jgi:RHS repeat-associated protein
LNVKDEAGHETESFASFTKRVGTAITSPALTLTTPDPSVDPISVFDESPYEILYTGDGTGGSAGLYVDGILVDDDDSDGLTLDIINGDYDEGESHFLYVKADDSGTIKYSAKTYNTVTQDLFDDTSMLETLDTNAEVTSGKLTLKETGGVYATNTNTVIQSNDVFDALVENAYVESVTFEVNDNIPTGTIISYEISNNGTDFVSVADEQTINFATVGTQIVVKATLNTTDSSVAPEILDWTVDVTQVDKGAEFVVKLVDEPTNVNAEPQVNYKTLIKWEDAVNPEGTTYKVYRVDCDNYDEDFDIQDGTLVGENIESTFFYDYNLNFDKTFSYKVIAVVNMGTLENPIYRESILSEYATASTMDSDEFDKRLGLQDYWRYTGFVTGSGSGQIELSQGNLSYQTTDFVFPGPMFVMTMRRTYNSQSTSKTALGYGTDFSFNTTLMMEYDEYETEVGVILKDGDGTIHRFIKNGSTYDSPTGVLMELSYDAQNEQWIISRKDGVSYIFDNNMMMYRLQDRNGNYLEYDYDEQGNIDTITDNAGNYITFAYNEYGLIDTVTVEGPDPMDSNDERVYKYSYTTDAMGKVRLAKRGLEGEIYFDEEFEYDSTTGELENIIDGEEHVYTIYYTSGEDTIIEIEYPIDDPITESFEISYGTNTTSVSFRGNNTVYAYDTNGCVTGITNSLGYTTTYGYDATSWQIDEVEYYNKVGASTTEEAITTAVVYDSYDNISIVTDDQGNTIEYDYIDPATQSYSLFDMPYSVTITSEDETESITTEYTYDTNGNVLTEVEANVTVATNTYYSGAWVDETNMGYPGQLHTSTDRYGSVTSYEYTVEGWLYRIYDDDDNYTEYEYDGMGNPIYITDAEGNITKTDYDLIGRKIKVYYTDGDNDFTDGTNDTEWWVYNNNHNVTHHYVGTGTEEVVTRYTYDDMNRMVKTYHNSNLYPEMTVNYDYYEVETGKYAQKVSYTDKEGIESAEYYDAIGRLIETRMVNGASYTNVTSYDYDKAGNMIEVTDGEGRVVEAQYDELNRTIATIADPSGLAYTTEHGYDYLSRETIVTDGEGAVTKYEYDDFNRLTKVTQSPDWTPDIYMDSIDLSSYGVPDMRNGIFSSDGTNLYIVDNGNTIIKQFTLSIPWDITTASFVTGNYFSVSSQMPAPRAIEFNSDGTKMYVGCYTNGRIYEYNLSTPWLVNTATYSNVSLDISSFVFSIQSMTFNSTGTILIVCDFSNANIKRYDLSTAWDISSATISNKTGNVATQTASPQSLAITSDGTMAWVLNNGLDDDATIIHKYTLSTAWDPSTMVYTNESEDITDKVEVRSGRGLVFGDDEYFCVFSTNDDSVYQYHIDQPITEIFETVYEYEVNVPGTTEDDDYIVNQVVDAEDGIKQTWFDNLGRVYKEVNDGTDDEDDLIIESVYHYDALGRMTYKEFADGTILGKEYDAKGNLWKEKYYQDFDDYDDEDNDDSPEDEADRTYTDYTLYVDYDSRGNLKRAEGEVDGEEFYHEWAYDTRDRVTQQKEYVSLNSNTAQNIISYSYWDNGQLKSVTYPATFADEYSSVSQKYYYNSYGQLSDIMMDTQDARSYYYDDSGRVIRTDTYIDLVDTGNIMSAYYTYDDTGLTTDIQYKLNGTLKERCQYIYDDNGMITTETINPYDSSTTILKTHTYDDIGRLTETTIDSTTYAYTYDAIGNRLTESDGTDSRTYEYNELFQLEQINKNSVKEFEYIYNDIGGQINQKEYDSSETLIEEQTFTYHENGLLKNVLIEDSDGEDPDKNEYYMYNGQEQRIVKEFNDGTDTTMTRYMYTGSEVIMTANSAGIKTTENILTPSGEIVSSQRFNENGNGTGWYSYNYDIRKSTTTIVASSGFAENYYEYDAFGETDATESLLNEIEFTGATSDSNTGLYYMNARYYNPNTGRFISQDSYKGSAYEPWTQNLYVYTGNNPVNFIDPTGFAPIYIDFFFGGSGDVDTSTPPTGPSNIVSDPEEDTDADTSSGGSGAGSGSGNNNTGSGLSLTDNMKDAGVEIIEIDGKEYYDYTNPVYLAITAAGNEAHYHIYNPLWFYNKVNHGKPYDIKREQPWNETIGEGTYPGSYDTEIYFWSGLTTPEKLGNIMYGYVGAASLFSDKTLYKGSIFASGINRTPDVKQEDITNEMVDHYYIRLGIKWYEEAIYDKSIFYR